MLFSSKQEIRFPTAILSRAVTIGEIPGRTIRDPPSLPGLSFVALDYGPLSWWHAISGVWCSNMCIGWCRSRHRRFASSVVTAGPLHDFWPSTRKISTTFSFVAAKNLLARLCRRQPPRRTILALTGSTLTWVDWFQRIESENQTIVRPLWPASFTRMHLIGCFFIMIRLKVVFPLSPRCTNR